MANVLDILSKLIHHTREGRIIWQPAMSGGFSTLVGSNAVSIADKSLTESGPKEFELIIRDSNGAMVEEVRNPPSYSKPISERALRLSELFEQARLSAAPAGSTLEDFASELEALDSLGDIDAAGGYPIALNAPPEDFGEAAERRRE